jgi:hypothetical protein
MGSHKCLEFKHLILNECKNKVLEKLDILEKELKYLAHDLAKDTKSSAGDKYETGREMTNTEINKLQTQVYSMNKSLVILNNTFSNTVLDKVALGSLIKTDTNWIFLAVSLGPIKVNGKHIMVISPAAPLAQILLGKGIKDKVSFNKDVYQIIDIC